jgi:hypothetical protein
LATLPGDTGPYEVDATTAEVGDAGIRMVDPVDMFYTGIECLSGDCSSTDIALGFFTPFFNKPLRKSAIRIIESQNLTGQIHHMLSKKILDALSKHKTLSGVFKKNSLLVQALNKASHIGYQGWHIQYDDEVVEWLDENQDATAEEFIEFLKSVYDRADLKERFPGALELLETASELLQNTLERIE